MSDASDYDGLEEITGIGSAIADNLRAAGIETPRDVFDASVEELAAVELIGESTARAIQNGESEGHRGANPTVDEHINDIRPHLEKPISDKAAIAQSPIGRKTHKEWLKKEGQPYERYQEMYEAARSIAEQRIVEDGLYGEADSSLVKFLLKATWDYEDKKTHEVDADIDQRISGDGFTVQFDESDKE